MWRCENVEHKTEPSLQLFPPKKLKSIFFHLQHLVDWSKPMLSQIGSITEVYTEWVNKPVDRPLRLFGPEWLEMLTKTPWWAVPLFWIPSIIYITKTGLNETNEGISSVSMQAVLPDLFSQQIKILTFQSILYQHFIAGIVLWTVLEYSLHRWVFHLNAENGGVFICTFHFLLHGLHHKVSVRKVFC